MKLNICLILSEQFVSTVPARSEIIEIYGNYMAKFGHRSSWIASSTMGSRQVRKEFFNNIPVYITPSHLIVVIFNKICSLIEKYKVINKTFEKEQFDLIQADDSALNGLLAIWMKRKYGIPFVFQYSFPADVYKVVSLSDPIFWYSILKCCFMNYILRKADLIFPISKHMEAELVARGISKTKMMVLPMGVNHELFSPQSSDRTTIRERYNLGNAPVIVYVGVISKMRQIDLVIYAFSIIKQHNNAAKLLIVGTGDDKCRLEELAVKLQVSEEVIFTDQVPYFHVPNYIAAADICLSPIPPLPIYKVSSPTKLFEYMAMGKPIVANKEIPEHQQVLEASGGGVLVSFDPNAFAEGALELLNNSERSKEMGNKGREWVISNRSYEILARKVENRYFELVNRNNVAVKERLIL